MAVRRTPFYAYHKEAGARLIDFGGWEMPVQYAGILEEHAGCRDRVGLFDVSHMGEVQILGPNALAAVQHLVTNDASKLVDGQAMYTAMCNERGGIVDDLIVYRFNGESFLICVNAALVWLSRRMVSMTMLFSRQKARHSFNAVVVASSRKLVRG